MKKPFYLTTTLPYVNADLHLGHALEFVRADIIARYKKLTDHDVFFNTGTDEHGMKIYEKAASLGLSAQQFVDQSFARFKDSVQMFGLLPDIHYIRTTDKHHEAAAQAFWQRVADNGYIYKKNYEAKYCVGCEATKTDSELVDGECPVHPGRALETISEENYFFKYSALGDKLLALYASRHDFVVPDFRFNEIKAFVERGLEDFSISRLATKMPWGIPVPGDADHVMYVWFDALTNYISTLGWPDEGGDFKKYWEGGTPTQYCGKDNLRFQAAMWQAMLLAAELPNSHQIVINGFMTGEGGLKMSKTLGNVVDPKDIVAEYGTEALRFFLAKEVSSFEDSPFTMERFKAAYNAHLANGLGNLVSRVMKMAVANGITYSKNDPFSRVGDKFYEAYKTKIESFDITGAMDAVMQMIQWCDSSIQSNEPFKKIKNEETKEEAVKTIKQLMFDIHMIAECLRPVIPETAQKIITLVEEGNFPEAPLFLRKD